MQVFYTNDFRGFYPVGTAAVVVARNLDEAYVLMTNQLVGMGLGADNAFTLHELATDSTRVVVLCNGDY